MKKIKDNKINYRDLNPNDMVFTPDKIAKYIVELFKPEGKILEPCSGNGAFLKYLPTADWCEITKGRDFFDYNKKVDWIVTNPPYSNFDRFLQRSMEIADNIIFLVPIAKMLKSWGTISRIARYGGIKKVWFSKASKCGFPFGFPVGAFHIKRDYSGQTEIIYDQEELAQKPLDLNRKEYL